MVDLTFIDNLVEETLTHYKSDWFACDRHHAEKDDHFVISMRSTGVDCLFLGAEKSYSNMMWAKACFDSERAEAIYEYNAGNLKLISHFKAREILKKAWDSCPEGYIELCEACYKERIPSPTVQEYLEKLADIA